MFETKETTQKLYVKLHTNPFDSESYIGVVPRNTVSMDALITSIAKNNTGISKYTVYHSAELLKDEIRNQLASGKAVSVLNLGTMYISVNGKVSSSNPSDISGFSIKFTPSQESKDSLSSTVADGVMYFEESPVIETITSQTNGSTDGNLIKEDFVELTGSKLKLGGTAKGIYFATVNENGTYNIDEATWISVDLSTLRQNTSKYLRFKLPSILKVNTPYFIIVRTSFCNSETKERKNAVTGVSAITVKIVE